MALNADDDDFEWTPPSESEMKVIHAQRERQDKISKLMGAYLLKGYKMLGECCEQCGTILLQDKQKKNYCVACQELDSDVDKDNPALNAQAALSQVRERQLASQPVHLDNGAASGLRGPLPPPANPSPALTVTPSFLPTSTPSIQPVQVAAPIVAPAPHPALSSAEDAVLHKLRWATQELQHSASVEASIQLCSLIRSCADSLRSLKELHQS
ncbi:protein ZNRD2-like isoform X2 [Salvelinus namaycush]|uniref:Protein ZNRD2-like isoform X2 n=1 Tax=Salvelinus namaycush TaxID=8040 RepID=A0A8U0PB36_SALNM|nr:protein ZNRD2-like isoform X2 [Salvelinus namaycush]